MHHINGDGEDAGIVYCEMQARENTGESLTHLAMLRQMYPGDNCGYRAETGGIMQNLRESTSHKKVRRGCREKILWTLLSVFLGGKNSIDCP